MSDEPTVEERLAWLDEKVEGLLHVVESLVIAGHFASDEARKVWNETR